MCMNIRMKYPTKNAGFTDSERKLSILCEKTFLKLWNYTSLYNDEGILKNKIGKEICDLLVTFSNNIIIFSDKEIIFNKEKNSMDENGLSVAWKRWKKKAIINSIQQIEGAESWIKNHSDRIFFDEKCQYEFPFINKENVSSFNFFRIAIANGASNTLSIGKDIGDFIINDIRDKNNNIVHVFDGRTIEVLMNELSTIEEFVSYLRSREEFIENSLFKEFDNIKELDILATYLLSPTAQNLPRIKWDELGFKLDSYAELTNSLDYKKGKAEDEISVIFDTMTNNLSTKFMNGEVIGADYNSKYYNQRIIEILCMYDRLNRRALSQTFIDKFKSTPRNAISSRAAISTDEELKEKSDFVIVIFPRTTFNNYSKIYYEEERDKIARAYSIHYQQLNEGKKEIITLVFDNISETQNSWDRNYETYMRRIYKKGFSVAYRAKGGITEDEVKFFLETQEKWGILKSSPIKKYSKKFINTTSN